VTMLAADRVDRARPAVRKLAIGLSAQSEFDQVFMPRIGMRFPRQLSYDKWLGIGRQLATVQTSSAWCLGDWLIHGEDVYSGRYRDAIEHTSLDYQTLRNYAWVARRFSLSRRRANLSFAHHAEVAGLPEHEQDFWLRKAEELSWSRNRLRQEVRGSLAERATAGDPDTARASLGERQAGDIPGGGSGDHSDVVSAGIQVRLSPEQLESCQTAAGRLGRSIEEWAASALDRAAREELDRKRIGVQPRAAALRTLKRRSRFVAMAGGVSTPFEN
jgi:hypothetical protein